MTVSGPFGAFGKIPALGDFLRTDMPVGFVDAWDYWLQMLLQAARRDLGPRWPDGYMTAPIWRFTLAQGLAGRLPVIGILMPSVDRVGRLFPLTLAAALPQGAPVILTHFAADAGFARLEELALDALERDLGRDQVLQRLALLPRIAVPGRTRPGEHGRSVAWAIPPDHPPAADVAEAMLDARLRQPSLWSAPLAGGTRLMVTEGLPSDVEATALFDIDAPLWNVRGYRP